MAVLPYTTTQFKQDSFDDAERIRGGAVGCACCGGSKPQQRSPLEPQPEPQMEQATPKVSAGRVPRISEPKPPAQSSGSAQGEKSNAASTSKSAQFLSTPQSKLEGGRALSSPPRPDLPPSTQSSGNRNRNQTLPALSPNKPTRSTPASVPPALRDVGENPAFPPTVYSERGIRTRPGPVPTVEAPFMKDLNRS